MFGWPVGGPSGSVIVYFLRTIYRGPNADCPEDNTKKGTHQNGVYNYYYYFCCWQFTAGGDAVPESNRISKKGKKKKKKIL